MTNKYEILYPDYTYHIYNRANGSEKLFLQHENYRYFLQKYHEHISPVADTFCHCLMPNHFHFLIRIKPGNELKEFLQQGEAFPKFGTLEKLAPQPLEKLLSKRFSNLFSSYTQAFNKQQQRMGSLFMKNFKRKKVTGQNYLLKLVHYIHYNPVEAGLCSAVDKWSYSSYSQILSEEPGFLNGKEIISWFDDKANFHYFNSTTTTKNH